MHISSVVLTQALARVQRVQKVEELQNVRASCTVCGHVFSSKQRGGIAVCALLILEVKTQTG